MKDFSVPSSPAGLGGSPDGSSSPQGRVAPLSVSEQARVLKRQAEAGPIGKKRSSFELYALLADCMSLALRCKAAPEDRQALIDLLKPEDYGQGRNRKGQVNYNSSEFQLVCRFVFEHKGTSASADRANASRYGKALDEAFRRGIGPSQIETTLREQGGINALFLVRPLKRTSVSTKTLYLTEAITAPKNQTFTVTLRRTSHGAFDVLQFSTSGHGETGA